MKISKYSFLIPLLACTISLNAQTWSETGDTIVGEAAGDLSGFSFSFNFDGSIVAIGAPRNSEAGHYAGHVRVYERVEDHWSQIGEDMDGEAADDYFGSSVSLNADGTIVAVGAYGNDGNGSTAGHVRVFSNVDGSWVQMGADIDGEGPGDAFGFSVCLDSTGNFVAVGAKGWEVNGQAKVLQFVEGNWIQVGNALSGLLWNEQFGTEVKLSSDGTILAVRSGYADKCIRVYTNVDGTWTQIGEDIKPYDLFSLGMNGDGNMIAVGDAKDGYYQGGRVRLYRNNEGSWEQLGQDIEGTIAHEFLGTSIAFNNNGSRIAALSSSRVVVYENQNDSLVQVGTDISTEYFGGIHIVDLSGDGFFVGFSDTHNFVDGGDDAGNVRVFQYVPPVPFFDTITVEACENELPYTFGTQTLTMEGTYTEVFQATTGVDSTVTLTLVVHGLPNPDFTFEADTLTSLNLHSSYQWSNEDGIIEGATSESYVIEKSGTYYLEVTDENGCTAISEGVQIIKTGNVEFENNPLNISVIPSPNDGNFRIRIVDAKNVKYNVEIYNSLGQKIIERELKIDASSQDEAFDLTGYPNGNYIIRIDEGQIQKIIKFVKLF